MDYGNGLLKPSYVYGTVHTIEKKEFFLTKSTISAFNSCKILATEQAAFMRYISGESFRKIAYKKFLPEGQTVANLLSRTAFDSVSNYALKNLDIPKPQYRIIIRLKPIYLSGYFMNKIYPRTTGYELVFWRRAAQRNKAKKYMIYEGLEEYKLTLAALDSLDLKEQASELMIDIRTNYSQFKELISLYKAQDIEGLYKMIINRKNSFYKILVVNRNLSWMTKLEKLIQSHPTFIAVGAAHLAGEQGLLNLLIQKGYIVKPILENSPRVRSFGPINSNISAF